MTITKDEIYLIGPTAQGGNVFSTEKSFALNDYFFNNPDYDPQEVSQEVYCEWMFNAETVLSTRTVTDAFGDTTTDSATFTRYAWESSDRPMAVLFEPFPFTGVYGYDPRGQIPQEGLVDTFPVHQNPVFEPLFHLDKFYFVGITATPGVGLATNSYSKTELRTDYARFDGGSESHVFTILTTYY